MVRPYINAPNKHTQPKPRLIVGIDPGTTTAWAVLELDGRPLQIGSSKELGLSPLISIVTAFGKPLIIGCDKRKTPGFVNDFARKCGSRVINPREDLKTDLKRELTGGIETRNTHEIDALASALFALKEITPLLNRVRKYIERQESANKENRTLELIGRPAINTADLFETVLATGINIKEAASLLEEEETLSTKSREDYEESQKKTRTLLSLLRAAQRETVLHRQNSDRLKQEADAWKQKTKSLEGALKSLQTRKTTSGAETRVKDAIIAQMNKKIYQLKASNHRTEKTIEELTKVILRPSSYLAAIVLENLSVEEFQRAQKTSKIKTTSTIFVKQPAHANPNVIDDLQSIQPLILTDDLLKNHPLPLVHVKGTPRLMTSRIAIFPTNQVSARVDEARTIHRIIEDYRKERFS